MTKKIEKLITYLSILQETIKLKGDMKTKYEEVDIIIDDDFIIQEQWQGEGANGDFFHKVEFPAKDIDKRIKTARDHLRYLKQRSNGHKYGE